MNMSLLGLLGWVFCLKVIFIIIQNNEQTQTLDSLYFKSEDLNGEKLMIDSDG